jgi:hypothetical protein
MANLNVSDFRGKFAKGGARANMFECTVNFPGYANGPDGELTSFMVRSAQLPASTVGLVEVPFRGRIVKLAGDRTFEPWTITVFNDVDHQLRGAFERWMSGMNEHESNRATQANDTSSYTAQMEVKQLDQTGEPSAKGSYKLINAFPTNVSAIDLDYAQVAEIETFTVTIEYDYWTNSAILG